MTGCPYIAGPACEGCDGSCWEPEPEPAWPTLEEGCAAYGHPPSAELDGIVYCACGQVVDESKAQIR